MKNSVHVFQIILPPLGSRKATIALALLALSTLNPQLSTVLAQGTAFTYQGRLTDSGSQANGSYDLTFALFNASSAGSQAGTTITNTGVGVTNGLFMVTLDFGNQFNGTPYWLEVGVRASGGGAFTTLSPRPELTPTPYALYAPSAGTAALATVANSTAPNAVNGASLQSNSITSDKILDGTITDADISPGGISGNKIIGGDLQAQRLMAGASHTLAGQFATIAGGFQNTISNAAWSADAIGGGNLNQINSAGDAAIAGGYGNGISNSWASTVAGGNGNLVTGQATAAIGGGGQNQIVGAGGATIAGGYQNAISNAAFSPDAIGGGQANQIASAGSAAIAGGYRNTVSNSWAATVAGGAGNLAAASGNGAIGGGLNNNLNNAWCGTIPGGRSNQVSGNFGFAAGYRAKANHGGAFVWGDSTEADFASSGNDQFLIRAAGGVGIGTNNPQSALHVVGTVAAGNFAGNGAGLNNLNPANLTTGTANISITGNASTATSAAYAGSAAMAYAAITASTANTATNLIGNVADAQLSANIARLNGTNSFAGTNTFAGVTVATNVNNVIAGAFIGNGGGLTNLNTAQFANSVLTNGQTGVTLGGTFNGNATTATTANSFSGSLSGDVTGTEGATVVSTVGGQTAANVASGASAANAASSANTASTIIKRDGSGNFSAGSVTLSGNLNLPSTTATTGIIYYNGGPLVHSAGFESFFAGQFAGNSTISGNSGNYNTGNGYQALYSNTTGNGNTANGCQTLYNNTNGYYNTAVGYNTLYANTSGYWNTAIGAYAMGWNTNGYYNTAVGYQALFHNTSGEGNTAVGLNSLYSTTSGTANTAIGPGALQSNTSGSGNIAIGSSAGLNITTGNNNIDIYNNGQSSDVGVIRIGQPGVQSSTYIAGISGVTISPSGGAVYVNANGQLGTVNSSRRFKEAVQDMASQSDILLSLRPVAFHYKPGLDPQLTPQYGLIAEEVEQVAPQLVLRDAKGEVLSVRYEQINAMLLNEFLKEHRKVEAQDTKIQALERSVAELKSLMSALTEKSNGGGQ